MRLVVAGFVALTAGAVGACTTYQDDLNRSQRAFDASEHERALAIMRQLESDQGRLSTADRAHYAYLRGMTDYRIGYRLDARHWLALAAAIEQATPGSLTPDVTKRMNDSLKELNEAVYSGGIEALSNDPTKAKPAQDEDETPRDSKDNQAAPDKDKGGDKGGDTDKQPKKKSGAKGDEG
jgi:hypothetical protein